jgi:hypothetical protein
MLNVKSFSLFYGSAQDKPHYRVNPLLWLDDFRDEFMLHRALKGSNSQQSYFSIVPATNEGGYQVNRQRSSRS